MDHLSYSSPIYTSSMMIAEPDFDRHTKETSSRSPTTVFAAAEMNNVFRLADGDDAIERIDDQEKENRPLAPSLICSFATDAELSTFSEDTEENYGEEIPEGNSNGMVRQRSVFRPVSGNKRRCDFTDDDEHDECEYEEYDGAPFKRRRICAPLLCRAKPIDSRDDDDTCDNDLPPMLSSSYLSASPFERVGCNSGSAISSYISTSENSSFTSLFAAKTATINNTLSVEAAVEAADMSANTFSIMPRQSTQPFSFEALPFLRAANITNEDDCDEN